MTSFMNSPLFDFLYLSHTHKEKEREHNFPCSDKLSACPMSRYQQEQVKVKATLSSENFSLNIFVHANKAITLRLTVKVTCLDCAQYYENCSVPMRDCQRQQSLNSPQEAGGAACFTWQGRLSQQSLCATNVTSSFPCSEACMSCWLLFQPSSLFFSLSSSPCSQYRLDKVQASAVFRNINICWRFVYWMNFMFIALSLILMLNQYYRCTVFYLEHSIYTVTV